MKRKNYITTGVLVVVLMLIGSAAYYFYPNAVKDMFASVAETNNVTEIDAAQYDTPSSTDDATSNDALSSSQASFSGGDDSSNAGSAVASPADPAVDSAAIDSNSGSSNDSHDNSVEAPPSTSAAQIISSSSTPALPTCSFPVSAPTTSKEIIINEIAWMGSASSSDAEWIEIKNTSGQKINLSGWELLNTSGKIKITFSESDTIPAGGFFLLARGSVSTPTSTATTNPANQKIYSGGLTNTGDVLALVDPQCAISDYLDASQGWPGGNNTTKQTLERDASGGGWHTSTVPGGTPDAENSAGPPPAIPPAIISSSISPGAPLTTSTSGNTSTNITDSTSTPTPTSTATGTIGTDASASTATTTVAIANIASTTSPDEGASASTTTSPVVTTTGNIIISAVQIAAVSSSANDFVTLYNPTGGTVDVSGWRLHKKSSTGTDYSLKVFPTGSMIAPGQSFTWANSTDGFSETIGANVSSTETLSADNSVALMDANGDIIDAVAWGMGTGQYGEGSPYPTDPTAGQVLTRQSSGGVMLNTGNNANDFALQ